MLKIKDNIDLKELENFGLLDCYDMYTMDYSNDKIYPSRIFVDIDKETRLIKCYIDNYANYTNLNLELLVKVLSDMIQADMIEIITEEELMRRECPEVFEN